MRAILSHAGLLGRRARVAGSRRRCSPATRWPGFVTAAALVRPSKSVLDLEAVVGHQADEGQGLRPAVSRDDLRTRRRGLGLPLDQHVTNVIGFMREQADALGLRGTL